MATPISAGSEMKYMPAVGLLSFHDFVPRFLFSNVQIPPLDNGNDSDFTPKPRP